MVEEDNVPWGSLVVLAAKPHQENVPWHEYQWRLCVSNQKMNQVTSPFTFPIHRFDDAVQDIDRKERYFISMDMNSGYWQLVTEEEACKRLASFIPDRKRRCKVITMGALNAVLTFVAI